jgi:hypothetical protein
MDVIDTLISAVGAIVTVAMGYGITILLFCI